MKLLVIVVLSLFVFICESKDNNYSCVIFDEGMEFLELYCENFSGTLPENCSNTYLIDQFEKTIYRDRNKVKELKYGGCDQSEFKSEILNFINLRSIDISQSKYSSLSAIELNHRYLEKFNASHNEISNIPSNYFDAAPNLIEIDFSHNNLKTIESVFVKTVKLTRIYLSNNKIKNLQNALKSLNHLEYVDLSNNLIYEIDDQLNSTTLNTVHVEHCLIQRIGCYLLSLAKNGASVYISFNTIYHIEGECMDNFDVVSSEHEVMLLKPDGNSTLHTSGKYVYDIETTSMDNIDVVLNEAEALLPMTKGTGQLQCNQGSFKNITRHTADVNTFKSAVKILQCFTPILKTVSLNGNLTGKLNNVTFQRLINIKNLVLSDAHLQDFDLIWIQNLSKLELFDISNNHLTTLRSAWVLKTFENLKVVKLNGNQLHNIAEVTEHLSPSLKELDLSGSPVGKLTSKSFERFEKMEKLHLVNTSLSFDDENPFEPLASLSELDVSDNNFGNADFILLSNTLSKLSVFVGANCKIANATKLMKLFSSALIKLDLSNNHVGHIDNTTFSNSPNIKQLYLRDANLTMVDLSPFTQEELRELDISNNNLENVSLTPPLLNLYAFHVVNCNITDISKLMGALGERKGVLFSIFTELDLSENVLNEVKPDVFSVKTFFNSVVLRNTNLSTFEIPTNIHNIDISYNHLSRIDLSSISRNINLSLEGNDLLELDSLNTDDCHDINMTISNNQFSCEYLARFLTKIKDRPHFKVIGDPWQQKHGEKCDGTRKYVENQVKSMPSSHVEYIVVSIITLVFASMAATCFAHRRIILAICTDNTYGYSKFTATQNQLSEEPVYEEMEMPTQLLDEPIYGGIPE